MTNWQSAAEAIKRTYTAKGRVASGCYSIEGIRLHERALRANAPLQLVLAAERYQEQPPARVQQLLAALPAADIPVYTVPDEVMTDLTDGRSLGGFLGLVKLPPPPALDAITQTPHPLLLITVDVVDPGNLGAMLRTGHASGITAFITIGGSDPFHSKAVRTSMGSLFKIPILPQADPGLLLAHLKKANIQTVGATAQNGIPLPQADFSGRGTAVFMGSEYFGLPEAIAHQLDSLVTIPMAEGIDSLSINAATAVILYEIGRKNV
ncbi:MAG: RNA methyltransferase [Chloroflexi bacterium]|nr:RNA methyltransferase [Chloroflexota bacterium]